MSFKNTTDIPLSLAVWLLLDTYDYNNDPYTISATTLLKPIKSVILSRQVPAQKDTEIADYIASRLGTAFHDSVEKAWLSDPESSLKAMGIPNKVIERLRVNPPLDDNGEPPAGMFNVFLERRAARKVGLWTVTGKFDQVLDGKLEDNKSTGVYNYIHQGNSLKYMRQGSIYRWLNPKIITSNILQINYLFTDWSARDALNREGYPKHRIMKQDFEMMSLQETEQFVVRQLAKIDAYKHLPQDQLPPCTPDELWQKPPIFKYYKNPANLKRSTKNYATLQEANQRLVADGNVGKVMEQKAEVKFCRYCNANTVCKQKEQYVQQGLLKL